MYVCMYVAGLVEQGLRNGQLRLVVSGFVVQKPTRQRRRVVPREPNMFVCKVRICMYVCIYVYLCICMYVGIHMHIHILGGL